jgi:ketosteroid isomerase-like protein
MTRTLAIFLLLIFSRFPVAAQSTATLQEQVTAADAEFFAALFNRCDTQALMPMVADDFEFFHDKWGQIAKSKDEFLASIRGMCERQLAGTDFKAKRRIVQDSVAIFPMKGIGAFQTGSHFFYRVTLGKPDEPTESARFAHLWRNHQGRWQLARVISYEHTDAARIDAK